MSYLTLERVSKSYGGQEVIADLDLSVEAGEFVCLVGPSGSGKSTLLRMIAGLEPITSGTIRVDGNDISRADPSERDMAMVFQSYALYPHMNVEENISFALRMRKTDPAVVRERVAEAIRMLKLEGLEKRRPRDLSGGQRQRVAMGRCVVRKPKLFLFDEPLSNLDAKLRSQTRHQIRHLHDQLGATSIFVTHDQVEAMTMADRIVLLDKGTIQQVGTPQELYLSPRNRFVAGFLGSPEMNMLPGRLALQNGELHLTGPVPMRLPASPDRLARLGSVAASAGEVEIGVRPEHLQVSRTEREGALALVVDTVEWLGAEAYAFGQAAGGEIGVRLPETDEAGGGLPRAGDRLFVEARSDRWHAFDKASGLDLLGPAARPSPPHTSAG